MTLTFDHPPRLDAKHRDALAMRAISADFAQKSGVSSRADNELRKVGFGAAIPYDRKKDGLQGICFEYRDPFTGEVASWRLKPDYAQILNGDHRAKYLTRKGDGVRAYFPHTTTREILDDKKVPIIITEGEFKALSIAENLLKIGKQHAVIGIAGVNGAWHRKKEVVPTPDGKHEKRSRGAPKLIDDLQGVRWQKRQVYICFDSDVGTHKHAVSFKKSKYQGAMGAEHVLAELLRAQGADVRIVEIPHPEDGQKVGADDYIAHCGAYDFYKLLVNNWVAKRDPDAILHRPRNEPIVFVEAAELVRNKPERPPEIIRGIIPRGGVGLIAGAPKTGKSGIALNVALSVVQGTSVFERFPTERGRVAYIETEIPKWSLALRLENMGTDLPEGFLVYTPKRFHLNWYENQGLKRVETGARDRTANLVKSLKDNGVSLLILDPFTHFHSLNENTVEDMSHVFQVLQLIARSVPCGVLVVHHHRKVARSVIRYEGAEDMRGSIAFFAEADAVLSVYKHERQDGTHRLKMKVETRHSEEPQPMELLRYGGERSWLWKAEDWTDDRNMDQGFDDRLKILEALSHGPMEARRIVAALNRPRATVYRRLNELEESGEIGKSGNLYFVTQGANRENA